MVEGIFIGQSFATTRDARNGHVTGCEYTNHPVAVYECTWHKMYPIENRAEEGRKSECRFGRPRLLTKIALHHLLLLLFSGFYSNSTDSRGYHDVDEDDDEAASPRTTKPHSLRAVNSPHFQLVCGYTLHIWMLTYVRTNEPIHHFFIFRRFLQTK